MGRKPNPLILEFFNRGAKLEDNSNRYEHTCKACGEKFPKGRIDSLTAHLVKKCPEITLRDRQKALLQLNDLPDTIVDPANVQAQAQAQAETPQLQRSWTALETLAEVSRQVIVNEEQDGRNVASQSQGSQPRNAEHARNQDQFELKEQWTPQNPPLTYEASLQRSRDKKASPQNANQSKENKIYNYREKQNGSDVAMSHSDMAAAAMAATTQSSQNNTTMLDPALMGVGISQQQSTEPAENSTQAALLGFLAEDAQQSAKAEKAQISQQHTWPSQSDSTSHHTFQAQESHIPPQSRVNTFSAVPTNQGMITEFSAEYGNGQKSSKPKVRGRFSEGRRKEVQEVRKRGACIRCRMLKKPCSGETPCTTCKNVESARLWKQPCIRARVADELSMYSANLHHSLAHHEIMAIKGRVGLSPSPLEIEVSHFPELGIAATFKALVGIEVPSQHNIDPNLMNQEGIHQEIVHRALETDREDHHQRMEAYIKQMSQHFYQKEPSPFMNATLDVALRLSTAKNDILLSRVLELWSAVHILVDHDVAWSLTERDTSTDGPRVAIDAHDAPMAYKVIHLQLSAAVERIAATISRQVLGDLERRLLLRSTNQAFETFLITIILLNCVEKSTWLFRSWEQDILKPSWPLDKTPQQYGSQGDHITDMLQMILRMRSIPPKTYVQPDTGLIVTDDEAAKDWLNSLNLSYTALLEKRDASFFDPADSRCFEMRFCSKLLLPISN